MIFVPHLFEFHPISTQLHRRVDTMLQTKHSLIQERKKAAAKTRVQKESIAKVMEEVRNNATKANKIISMALTGKISLDALTASGSSGPGSMTKRSKSATTGGMSGSKGKRGSKRGDRKVHAEDVGLGRDSKSSADFDAEFEKTMEGNDQKIVYSKPDVPQDRAPQPYKSPYEPSSEATGGNDATATTA